jgi:short-subunit dehydrogenase
MIEPVAGFSEIEKNYKVKTAHYKVDVSSISSLEEGFAAFKKDFDGNLDICVPCAGINKNVSFLDTSFADHQRLLGVNISGVYFTAQLAAKMMIENGTMKGSIVLVASIASYMAIRSQSSTAYCGTKGAVRAMCPAIAAELNQYVFVAIFHERFGY